MAHRYFTTDITDNSARITGQDATHLCKVLRMQKGDILTLCDGKKTDYTSEIISIAPSEVLLRILDSTPCLAEPSVWVEAYIGYAKGERMDFAIQKSVELGASAIHPFFSTNTVVKPAKNEEAEKSKIVRLNRIASEAAKQSGRGILPLVSSPLSFAEVLEQSTQCELSLFLYEKGGKILQQEISEQKTISIITGAEGGFTPEEAEKSAKSGCVHIGLGKRILRCETAPLAALAAIMTITHNFE